MFVSIILDTEYMGMGERLKWFLKNISHAKEMDALIITHEYLDTNYQELAEKCGGRFYHDFEMDKLDDETYRSACKGFIPDRIFADIESEHETRTKAIMFLAKNRCLELERCMIGIIDDELKRRKDMRIEGIFNCCECFESIRSLGRHYGCPVIPYVFSAIRKVHGYRQTLYTVNLSGRLYTDAQSRERFQDFLKIEDINIYSYRELLALFGKDHNIPLIKYLDNIPEYEAGICGEAYHLNPNSFMEFQTTDDDLYYECQRYFPNEKVITRSHPLAFSRMGVSREYIKNDPLSFILSCKRIMSTQSQILLKAMLWKRAVYMKGNTLAFSFLCSKEMRNEEPVDLAGLNFFLLSYLVPDKLMFNAGYWRWRLEKPGEKEIYDKHMRFYFDQFHLDADVMRCGEEEKRFVYLLKCRHCDEEIIEDLLDKRDAGYINYGAALSKIDIWDREGGKISMYRRNEFNERNIHSVYKADLLHAEKIRFYPFIDVAGNARISEMMINGKCVMRQEEFSHFPKNDGFIEWTNTGHTNSAAEIAFIWQTKD